MKRWFTVAVVAAIAAALSPSVSAQWPLYPLPGVPKGPDGKPNLAASAPRTADGKPDLSGIWMRSEATEAPGAQPRRAASARHVRECRGGIQRRAATPAVGGGASKEAHRGAAGQTTLMRCASPRSASIPPGSATAKDRSDARTDSHHLRVELRPSHDLHRRPASPASGGAAAVLARLLRRTMGGRHARGRVEQLPRRWMARYQGQPVYRRSENDRAVPARELRTTGDRVDPRRSEGVHEALYRSESCSRLWQTDRR